MRPFLQMMLASAKMTVRNRMALFWLMLFPLLFILMFGFLVPNDDFTLRVGVAGADSSPMAQSVVEQMDANEGFEIEHGSADAELAELSDGNRNVVLVFGEGSGDAETTAEIHYDQANMTTAQVGVGAVQQFLYEAEIAATQQPRLIDIVVSGVDADQFDFMDFLVPGILAMALMTNGVIALSTTFVSYRERGTLRRIKATPFPLWAFILAEIAVQMVVAIAQAAILLGTAVLLFDVTISDSYISLALMVALGALGFLSIGFAISGFARDAETASGISNVVVFPMLFLGGVFFPIEDTPGWLRPIIDPLPLTYLVDGLREIVINGASITDVWVSVAVMLATAVVGVVIAVRLFRWESRPM